MKHERAVRLATWNIHMGVGLDNKRDLNRTAKIIQQMKPDLIGLQEVDNHIKDQENDLHILRTLTGLKVIAGPTMKHAKGDYGNALLTCLPVQRVERYEISVHGREPRGLLIVHLVFEGKGFQVAVTHLGLRPAERRYQVRQLIKHLSSGDRSPLILMGDFNEWLFWGRPLRWLRQHFRPLSSPATFPSRWPFLKLDHILSDNNGQISSLEVFNTPLARHASDHLPLTARYCF